MTPRAGQKAGVLLLLAGIFVQILMGGELGRIDEVGGHDAVGAAGRLAHQGQVPLVQGAHGRNHAYAEALSFPVPHGRAQVGDGADYGERRRRGGGVRHDEAINLFA
ncbi:hypothetical protein PsaNZ63_29670 [Pseudomonas syringae pv. actinidiae]|nr:hypothetical protein PsaNZ63_29670 [Pseudomonas syringae pv. actinidiae]